MKLDLATFIVDRVTFSDKTGFSKGELCVDVEQVKGIILEDKHFQDAKVHIVHPGQSVRIIHALDVVEPRYKVVGPGCTFPGVLGPPIAGSGLTHRLAGLGVVTAGPPAEGEMLYFREGIIDICGPGAFYSPFSLGWNLVLELHPNSDLSAYPRDYLERKDVLFGSGYAQEYNMAVRKAGFGVASYLASATAGMKPDLLETWELIRVDPSLPRVACAVQMLGQRVYGEPVGWQPTLIHPNEVMDGALFGCLNMGASMRQATSIYLNHPLIEDLYRRHGHSLSFSGVLIYPAVLGSFDDKERLIGYSVKLLKMLRVAGVVLTSSAPGNSSVDVMMLCRQCEQAGIKTTVIHQEMALTPDDPGLSYPVAEADAIINTGNLEAVIDLPAVDQVIGGDTLLDGAIDARKPFSIKLVHLLGATSPAGYGRLTSIRY